MTSVRIQREPFDLAEISRGMTAGRTDVGALVTFTGLVRDSDHDRPLTALEIEHYPGMSERAISEMCAKARDRWSLIDVCVVHRHGLLRPGEQIMMVATLSGHRAEAFAAADFLMDYLKSRAPFWKREQFGDGTASWVAAKDADEAALDRWTA